MNREVNIDSIAALNVEIIRLKRTRNSLLNIARIPPEILGYIFRFNTTRGTDRGCYAGLQRDSYNFLLVCHHWFEVARHTPELWSFWGTRLEDWKRQCPRSGITPVDLVLDDTSRYGGAESFDRALQEVLRDRVARNAIRKVHLRTLNKDLLTAIISLLAPEDAGVKNSSIESIALSNSVDVSGLFARHRFPELRDLFLSGCFEISPWDYLKSHTMALTSLCLAYATTSPIPASQLLSLLASNPNIRDLTLRSLWVKDDCGSDSEFRVPLPHLERFSFVGYFRHVVPVLRRLELPEEVDDMELELEGCTPKTIREVTGPYIRDYLRHNPGFKERVRIRVLDLVGSLFLHATVIGVGDHDPSQRQEGGPRAVFRIDLPISTPDEMGKPWTNLLAFLPRESIVYLETNDPATEAIAAMPNIETLHLTYAIVDQGFLLPNSDGPDAHTKLLPSLRRLYLENPRVRHYKWDPLLTYLAHQTSGNQRISLKVFGEEVHICSRLVKQIEGMVEEFDYQPNPWMKCPFGGCL